MATGTSSSGRTAQDPALIQLISDLNPVNTNSIAKGNFNREQAEKDAEETRIVVHPRFPNLVENFLAHKRKDGSSYEKRLYGATKEDWTWQQEVARLIEKRPLVFMTGSDLTVLRDGRKIGGRRDEWDRVGTEHESQNNYLSLEEYLSYDEIMLGSLIGVSSPSYFINDGSRMNRAKPGKPGTFEPRGIIIGLVGSRFEREDRMDSSLILKDVPHPRQHPELREIFQAFFNQTKREDVDFDEDMYRARLRVTFDILLLEAGDRAKAVGKKAYVYIVGLGLGVWQHRESQPDQYLQAFEEALRQLGRDEGRLDHIGTLEFAWINNISSKQRESIQDEAAKYGIDIIFSKRNPAAKLEGDKQEQLLVISYAWDGNSFPGNEYWLGSLVASGDPAAACMSTIAELHNPVLNPGFLERIQLTR
jgi:hypothetical protein